MTEYEDVLNDYIPKELVGYISLLLVHENVTLKITKERTSKLGDYYYHPLKGHCISINYNLNPYSFTITLLHELAHLKAFKIFSRNIKAHGQEWKFTFKALMYYPLKTNAFPNDVRIALMKHMKNPKASSVRDINLKKVLRNYDENSALYVFVDDIPFDAYFELKNGSIFKKIEKLRTRYKCKKIDDGRLYFVNGSAEAKRI